MRRRATTPFVLFFLIWVCFGPDALRAQTPPGSGSCPPSNESQNQSTDEAWPKAIIDELTFDGPIHLPYSDLEPAIEAFNRLGASADSKSEWLDEFLETNIRGAWQDRGYFKVLVNGRAEPRGSDPADQHFSVVLHVDEGLQYRLATIQFRVAQDDSKDEQEESNYENKPVLLRHNSSMDDTSSQDDASSHAPPRGPVFPIAQLRSFIPLQEGDILSAEKLREGLDALRKLYGSHGYIDFTPSPVTEVDDENQTVSMQFVLDEEKQFRIGKIEVVGLSAKAENTLIWKLRPGDIFNDDLFKQFFEDNQAVLPDGSSPANAELYRDTKDGIADIKLRFRSCPP
jgi:outer membrane protein assembly factor BamA